MCVYTHTHTHTHTHTYKYTFDYIYKDDIFLMFYETNQYIVNLKTRTNIIQLFFCEIINLDEKFFFIYAYEINYNFNFTIRMYL